MADEEKNAEATTEEVTEKAEETAPAEETKEEEKKQEAPKEEAKPEEKKAEPKEEPKKEEKKPEPSGKFKELIKQLEEMSVLELSELVKTLEDRFGVSAAAPVAVAGGGAAVGGAEEAAEEKTAYTVHLAASGGNKIAVIKAVREVNNTLGLKEAKDLVDAAPADIRKDVPKDDAEAAKAKLEEAGATVELK